MSAGRDGVVLLAGGVGGARMASGLAAVAGDALTVIANTADDTELYGLLVMPDHDTVMYTLAGIADPVQGWGIAGESFATLDALARLGEETWFRLGDRDLATHIARTARIRAGERPTDVSLAIQRALGVGPRILPMSDDPVRTEVRTADGWLAFQEWFVHRHQEPAVAEIRFGGIERSRPTPEVTAALASAATIVIGPSNPLVSIRPILDVPGIREVIADARRGGAAIVAVSPIVGGRALRGPADRMLADLGHESSALGVARLHAPVAAGFVLDEVDRGLEPGIADLGLATLVTDTVMAEDAARARLARDVLAFAEAMRG